MTPPMPPERPLILTFLGDPNSIHTRRWLGFFVERGHAVHLILASDRAPQVGLDPRITLHPFPSQPRRVIRGTGIVAARRRLRALLAATHTDVLHAHYLTGYGWLARLAGFHPYVITVWGSDVFLTARQSLQARVWARIALGGADRVTADSAELARGAVALGAKADRTRIVQFGVETERFAPGEAPATLRERLAIGGRRVVFAPRSIAPLYQTTTVIDALAGLPSDVALVMSTANADPGYLETVQQRIDRSAVRDRVRLVSPIPHDEMPDYYRLADVVLSIPETDGTPVSILEAMACGTSIVASDLPSVREWLSGLDGAALVPVGDAEATSAAIMTQLGRSATERLRAASAMRSVVVARGDHRRNLLDVEGDYLRLVGRTR